MSYLSGFKNLDIKRKISYFPIYFKSYEYVFLCYTKYCMHIFVFIMKVYMYYHFLKQTMSPPLFSFLTGNHHAKFYVHYPFDFFKFFWFFKKYTVIYICFPDQNIELLFLIFTKYHQAISGLLYLWTMHFEKSWMLLNECSLVCFHFLKTENSSRTILESRSFSVCATESHSLSWEEMEI